MKPLTCLHTQTLHFNNKIRETKNREKCTRPATLQHSLNSNFDSDRLLCARMSPVVDFGNLAYGELRIALCGGEALMSK